MPDNNTRYEYDFKSLPKEYESLHSRLSSKLFEATINEAVANGWHYASIYDPKRKCTPIFDESSDFAQTELVAKMVLVNSVLKWLNDEGYSIVKTNK